MGRFQQNPASTMGVWRGQVMSESGEIPVRYGQDARVRNCRDGSWDGRVSSEAQFRSKGGARREVVLSVSPSSYSKSDSCFFQKSASKSLVGGSGAGSIGGIWMCLMVWFVLSVFSVGCSGNDEPPCRYYSDDLRAAEAIEEGLKEDDPVLAIQQFDVVVRRDPKALAGYFERARRLREFENAEAAMNDLSEVIRLCPELRDAYELRAELYLKMGFREKSRADQEMAAQARISIEKLKRSGIKRMKKARKLLGRAKAEEEKGNLETALESYDKYLRYVGGKPSESVLIAKTRILYALGEYRPGIDVAHEAMRMRPVDVILASDLTIPYLEKIGDYKGALIDLDKEYTYKRDYRRTQLCIVQEKILAVNAQLEAQEGKDLENELELGGLIESMERTARSMREDEFLYAAKRRELKGKLLCPPQKPRSQKGAENRGPETE